MKNYIAIPVGHVNSELKHEFFATQKEAKEHCNYYNFMSISCEFFGDEEAWKKDPKSVSWEYWSRDQFSKTFGQHECAKAFGV